MRPIKWDGMSQGMMQCQSMMQSMMQLGISCTPFVSFHYGKATACYKTDLFQLGHHHPGEYCKMDFPPTYLTFRELFCCIHSAQIFLQETSSSLRSSVAFQTKVHFDHTFKRSVFSGLLGKSLHATWLQGA